MNLVQVKSICREGYDCYLAIHLKKEEKKPLFAQKVALNNFFFFTSTNRLISCLIYSLRAQNLLVKRRVNTKTILL
jgi:hypothetical protein